MGGSVLETSDFAYGVRAGQHSACWPKRFLIPSFPRRYTRESWRSVGLLLRTVTPSDLASQ
jgi:hypothetical protein